MILQGDPNVRDRLRGAVLDMVEAGILWLLISEKPMENILRFINLLG